MRGFLGLLVALVLLHPAAARAGDAVDVDVLLVLAIDTSSSVSDERYDLQMTGYAEAFRSRQVADAIDGGSTGKIAVTVVHWCDFGSQMQMTSWVILSSGSSLLEFSSMLAPMKRMYHCYATSITGAIHYGTELLKSAPLRAHRKIIDISGDGVNNTPPLPQHARNVAVRNGITINGLAITEKDPHLLWHYTNEVIGGPRAFVIEVRSYEDFASAIRRKLTLEIAQR